jgi:hypothetical protein
MLRERQLYNYAMYFGVTAEITDGREYHILGGVLGETNVPTFNTNLFTSLLLVTNINCGGRVIAYGYDGETRLKAILSDGFGKFAANRVCKSFSI